MNYWWVNQKRTFKQAVKAGYLWSPRKNKNGGAYPFYDYMTKVRPGDVVFAFANARIKALAIVNGAHFAKDLPEELKRSDNKWRNEGWAVPVDYHLVDTPLRVSNHMETIGPLLPTKHSPLQDGGKANQAYLFPVPDAMASALLALLDVDQDDLEDWRDAVPLRQLEEDQHIRETVKQQLIQSRKGQGVYRKNVGNVEKVCRVTGTTDAEFLIASHIKPWAKSNNSERLDGNNGLLLAPHVDRLFDRGYISFNDDGSLILSKQLPQVVQEQWNLAQKIPNTPFSDAQVQYLNYHRLMLLRK